MGSFISPLDGTQDKRFPDRETLKRVLSKAWPRVSAVGWTGSSATKKNSPVTMCPDTAHTSVAELKPFSSAANWEVTTQGWE